MSSNGPLIDAGCLAEERQRDRLRVHSRVLHVRRVVGHLRDHPARRGYRRDQRQAVDGHGVATVGRGVDGGAVGQQFAGGGGGGLDSGCAGGGLDPPGVGGAENGNGHVLATFRRPRRRVRVNSLLSRSALTTESASWGRALGVDAKEVLGHRGSPLGEARGGERCPAGLQSVVEHVAVGEVLDEEAVRIAPVVEDLAALDVAADAPGPEIAALREVFAACGERIEVADLIGGVHVAVWQARARAPGCGGRRAWSPRSQRMKLITGPRARWPG